MQWHGSEVSMTAKDIAVRQQNQPSCVLGPVPKEHRVSIHAARDTKLHRWCLLVHLLDLTVSSLSSRVTVLDSISRILSAVTRGEVLHWLTAEDLSLHHHCPSHSMLSFLLTGSC
ncbi:voltage-dependent L-type calcium channel subunit alpha-1C-like [Platysternon megacephalum]|uniref:Voltage-dependent L-type calcium channel subunit alpha-1C-like n=1 Tax=Platysternon megacephalum TaxID=55544 RepID=A0A4D9E8V0_9SAUR|nr:voltage-dependent L-type calcium channel subunit alpha-1C-like [Platysternon megacephalum]